jgi:probable HAF family extracellular repeat protein
MSRINRTLVSIALLTAGMSAFSLPAAAQTKYTVTDLGVLDGLRSSCASHVDDNGVVSGYCLNLDIDEFACSFSFRPKYFVFKNGKMTESVKKPEGNPIAAAKPGSNEAILRKTILEKTHLTEFGVYVTTNSRGDAIGEGIPRAYFCTKGMVVDLSSRYPCTAVRSINENGQIAGYCGMENGGDSCSFLYEGGKFTYLDELSGKWSKALHINDGGQIVGETGAYSASRAYLYQNGKMQDLNKTIPADSGWVLRSASCINNHGQIVGWGAHNGKQRAFLLTPIQPVNPSKP